MEDALRMVEEGACSAWPLPTDPTCAGIARRLFRRAAGELALDTSLADDGVTMISELAANTLHAHRASPEAGPELWFYLRGAGPLRELVCKVFDSYPGWLRTPAPGRAGQVPLDSMSGRGLDVVHEMSGGHWGYHLTRSRLGDYPVRGKAVWFALPAGAAGAGTVPAGTVPAGTVPAGTVPAGTVPAGIAGGRVRTSGVPGSAREAMAELEAALTARGFEGNLVRADDPAGDMAVLSLANGLTVWCRAGAAWLRAPGARGQRWGYADLVEVAEQSVEAYETLAEDAEVAPFANATRTGALTLPKPTGNI
jgi:hypothetical protein